MTPSPILAALGAALALQLAPPARAGDGHDHGHDHGPAAAPGSALPRFATAGDAFELVGVLQGRQLTLYLDRADDNTPVTDARIELDIGGARLQARPQADGFVVTLAAAPPPGVLPVTATVTAGQTVDLLAAELDLHAPAAAGDGPHGRTWTAQAGTGVAALAALAALAAIGRRVGRRPGGRTGAPAATHPTGQPGTGDAA